MPSTRQIRAKSCRRRELAGPTLPGALDSDEAGTASVAVHERNRTKAKPKPVTPNLNLATLIRAMNSPTACAAARDAQWSTSISTSRSRREPTQPISASQRSQSIRILIVKDDPEFSQTIATYLGGHNMHVVTVSRRQEMLRRIAERPPNLMILIYILAAKMGSTCCARSG